MSFRYKENRDDGQVNPNKIELGEPRSFNMEGEKSVREDSEDNRFPKFDSIRGRRQPFGRGRRPSPGRDKPYGSREFGGGFNREDTNVRDRSPARGGGAMDDRFPDRFKKDDSGFHKRDDMGRKDGRSFYGDDNYRDRYPEGRSRFEGSGNLNPRFDRENQYKSKSLNFPNVPPKGFHNDGFPKPNECEIIVVNKQQRMYAESVESRVKHLGILVDILFLKDEALLTQTIDDIARRGSLFAMVISPQNETHGSVTVNILHGTPQEHRNMPLDDALKLVARNFHDHVRTQQETMERERAERGPYVGVVPADRDMQLLLRMLADGRWVSQTELDRVIRYLKERRDKMTNSQGDRPPSSQPGDIKLDTSLGPKTDTDVTQKEQDLQNRIINLMSQGAPDGNADIKSSEPGLGSSQTNLGAIMTGNRSSQPQLGSNLRSSQSSLGPSAIGVSPNQSSMRPMQPGIDDNPSNLAGVGRKQAGTPTNLAGKPGSGLPNEPASSATYLNFDYPSVQKALDNLMQTDPNLLKNITLSSTASSSSNITAKPSSSIMGSMGEPQSPLGGLEASSGSRPGMGSRGQGGMPDMGPARGSGGMPDMGPARGSGGMGARGPGGMMDMGGMGSQRGPGNIPDMGSIGAHRGPGNVSDMGGIGAHRGPGNIPDMGPQRGPGNMADMGQRGPGMGNMGPPRGSGGISDMGGMGAQRGGNMGPPQGMGHVPPNMGHGSNFSGPNQHNYLGPNQQGNFPGSMPYNSASNNMMNMPRQNYGGGNQGPSMGSGIGGPRRY